MTDIQLFKKKNEYMDSFYPSVTAADMYSDIFPLDSMEKKGDATHRASNPIFSYKRNEDGRAWFQNEIVFADHFQESVEKTQKNDMALCSMCSYSGRKKSAKNAFKCHGFCIDLDGVGMPELESFWGWVEELKEIPHPTYVANSGHGLHVYYVFENPVPLYPQVARYLQRLKRELTNWVWNYETSNYKTEDRQYQGIYQSFRMVGSRTKLGQGKAKNKYLVRAWKTGKKVSIHYLNQFVDEPFRCPENPDFSSWDWADEEHHSLSECQELYPDWYLKRIINKEPSNQYKCNRALYDWWLKKIQERGNAKEGTRYHCVSMLYVYAQKCMISKEFVDADAMALIEPFNHLAHKEDNDFTEKDVMAAAKFLDTKYVKMSRAEIERRTKIKIEPCRRNGRDRATNLKIARFAQELKYPNGSWRANNGRPKGSTVTENKYSRQIAAWQKANPKGKKADCIRALGLNKRTVYKWWNTSEKKRGAMIL